MTSGPIGLDLAEVSKANAPQLTDVPAAPGEINEKNEKALFIAGDNSSQSPSARKESVDADGKEYPTPEEVVTLRRVCGTVPWGAYTIAFVELCERFSYYGTTVVFVNFIQNPLPDGSTTGSSGTHGQSGALGLGQRASTGLTTFNSMWAYVMPLLGAYMADQYWGRFKTIQISIGIAIVGHIILIIATIPSVIAHPNGAVAAFAIGLIIFGVGVGGFKPNVSPLIAEQYEAKHPKQYIKIQKSGERTIVDPTMTVSRIYMYFYLMINLGSLAGQIGMVYAEKYVGYWLSFVLPTVMFLCTPVIMFLMRNKYARRPPTGSVLAKALRLWALAMKGRWSINPVRTVKNLRADDFWENVKPSRLGANKPSWMTFDDVWVDEVRRGLKACTVFLWYPVYWLSYNQMTNNLISQAATMELHGAPNDLINNIDPIALVIFIPITDLFLYPGLERLGIHFTPVKRIAWGFALASASMIAAAVIQYYIYHLGACGKHPSSKTCESPAPINVWVQTIPYLLIAFSEIFASITGLEYAFTKAPKNMRSVVTAVFLFMSAISYAIGEAFVSLSADPLLVWNYTVIAVLAAIAGVGFWAAHHKLDKEEDKLNFIAESSFKGRKLSHGGMNA
ncbi:MAG: hypothetical protein LQ338_003842 [Usnochroma carphineum]|nr:MAG: hypothetical protein LQ338_003842 [Usnochroma carphineum]